MDLHTFRAAINLAATYGHTITIGGGEPTMHPDFWKYFGIAMEEQYIEGVWMATNGSITKRALALADIAATQENYRFNVALSQDAYHDPIDMVVRQKFDRLGLEIRDVTNNVATAGAAVENDLATHDDCVCAVPQIKPNGDIYACGCDDAPAIGNVHEIEDGVFERAIDRLVDGCSKTLEVDDYEYIYNRA